MGLVVSSVGLSVVHITLFKSTGGITGPVVSLPVPINPISLTNPCVLSHSVGVEPVPNIDAVLAVGSLVPVPSNPPIGNDVEDDWVLPPIT